MPVHICHHQSYSRVTSHLRLNWHVIHISLTSCFCGFFLVQTFFAPKISRLPTLISCSGSIPSCGARREPSKEPIGHLPRYLFSIKNRASRWKIVGFFRWDLEKGQIISFGFVPRNEDFTTKNRFTTHRGKVDYIFGNFLRSSKLGVSYDFKGHRFRMTFPGSTENRGEGGCVMYQRWRYQLTNQGLSGDGDGEMCQ